MNTDIHWFSVKKKKKEKEKSTFSAPFRNIALVVVCHSCNLKRFGWTKSQTLYLQDLFFLKNKHLLYNMHCHFIGGCTNEINTSFLLFQKGRGTYCMHGLTTSIRCQCAQTAEIIMECFKCVACLIRENARDYALASNIHIKSSLNS